MYIRVHIPPVSLLWGCAIYSLWKILNITIIRPMSLEINKKGWVIIKRGNLKKGFVG